MGIDDSGEHSQNSNSDGERPFKKAKYAWQVKGRSHLKESNKRESENNNEKESKIESNETMAPSTPKKPCQGCVYLNKILNHSENLMAVDDDEDDDSETSKFYTRRYRHVPVTMVPKLQKSYGYYLSRWQARQIAKSFVDNTINSALEKWMISPFEDAIDFFENCENGGLVEDEGILMAIQSHGLQSQSIRIQECRPVLKLNNRESDIDIDIISSDSNETLPSGELTECTCKTKLVAHVKSDQQSSMDPTEIPSPSHSTSTSEPNLEHFDFLSTAVAVAIKKKGLNI